MSVWNQVKDEEDAIVVVFVGLDKNGRIESSTLYATGRCFISDIRLGGSSCVLEDFDLRPVSKASVSDTTGQGLYSASSSSR